MCRIEDNKIVETYFLLDLIDLMQQARRVALPPSRGIDGLYPPSKAAMGSCSMSRMRSIPITR